MAYNPFDVFRRNQKILFAIVTIFVMFTFVLSFGQNDFFSAVPRWIASQQSYGEVMAVVDGSKIRESELSKLQSERVLANQFMLEAARPSQNRLMKSVVAMSEKVSQANKQIIQGAMQWNDPNFLNSLMQRGQMNEQTFNFFQQMQQNSNQQLFALSSNEKAPAEDRETAQKLSKAFDLRARTQSQNANFFASAPNKTKKQQIDFILWLKKADALGIKYTDADLDQLIEEDLPSLTMQDREGIFAEFAKTRRGGSKTSVLEALKQEYRVRAAQVAMMGSGFVRGKSVGLTTPYDLYTVYKTNTAQHRYGFISVPVENYVPLVSGSPTDSELREIYNKAKSVEPNPAVAKPGIKEPRQLKLQWIETTGNEPFYVAAAEKRLPLVDTFAKLSGPFMELTSTTPLSKVVSAYTLSLKDPMYDAAYSNYVEQHKQNLVSRWYSKNEFDVKVLDTSLANRVNIGITMGLLGGSFATSVPLMTAPILLTQQADRVEKQQRLQAALALLPPPIIGNLTEFTANAVAHLVSIPAPLPVEVVKSSLNDAVRKDLKYFVAQEDVVKFRDDLAKLTDNKKDKAAEAQKMIDEFVKSRGIRFSQSADFHNVFTIGEDPGLLSLKARLKGPHSGPGADAMFGRRFFFKEQTEQPQPTTGFFDAQPYPEARVEGPTPEKSQIFAWRSDEIPAKQPESFAAAREKCVQIWKMQKARELAQADAEALAKKLEGKGDNLIAIGSNMLQVQKEFQQKFTEPAAQSRVKQFEIDQVAPVVVMTIPGTPPTVAAEPYRLMPIENLKYPNDQMQAEILAMNDKPLASTTVLVDEPKSTYYVVVSMSASIPGEKQFAEQIFPATSERSNAERAVKTLYVQKSVEETRNEALALLRSEFNYKDENPKLNEKIDSSSE